MVIAPFGPRMAIDPLEAIFPFVTTDVVGSGVGPLGALDALVEGAGEGVALATVDGLGAELAVGVALPQAATSTAVTTPTNAARSQRFIGQRYARRSGSDRPCGANDDATVELSRRGPMLPGMPARDDLDAITQARLAEQAWTACRRMIARGERPGFRIEKTGDGETIHIVELPWLGRLRAERTQAIERARDAIGKWLGADPSAFDVERD
jgi:hypothetical protein